MIVVYWWQIVLAVFLIMGGVALIVEFKINKSQLVVSEYLTHRDERMKKVVLNITDRIVDEMEVVDSRVRSLENGRSNQENN